MAPKSSTLLATKGFSIMSKEPHLPIGLVHQVHPLLALKLYLRLKGAPEDALSNQEVVNDDASGQRSSQGAAVDQKELLRVKGGCLKPQQHVRSLTQLNCVGVPHAHGGQGWVEVLVPSQTLVKACKVAHFVRLHPEVRRSRVITKPS